MTKTTALAALAATLTLAATAAATAPVAAAAPLPEVHTGMFRVELEGVQRTSWTHDWTTTEGCDVTVNGSGSETIRFRAKPVTVKATWIGETRVFTRGTKTAALDLAATIARQGREQAGGEICSYGDGDAQPVVPDCGTKRSRLTVDLDYASRRSDLMAIRTDTDVPLGPFRACPSGGVSWPSLLDSHPVTYKPVGAELPIADLFRYGKNIVIARDRAEQDGDGARSTTTIRWTLSFTRLDGRRGA